MALGIQDTLVSTCFPLKHETWDDMAGSWSSTRAWTVRRCAVARVGKSLRLRKHSDPIFSTPSNFALELTTHGNSSGKVRPSPLPTFHQSDWTFLGVSKFAISRACGHFRRGDV